LALLLDGLVAKVDPDFVRCIWKTNASLSDFTVVIVKGSSEQGSEKTEVSRSVPSLDPGDPGFAALTTLPEGVTYTWYVTAKDKDDKLVRSASQTFTTRATTFTNLKNKGYKLQRSITLDKDNATEAATIGFKSSRGASDSVSSEFAFIYQPKVQVHTTSFKDASRRWDKFKKPGWSIEARLAESDAETEKSNAISLRASLYQFRTRTLLRTGKADIAEYSDSGSYSVKYETTSNFKTDKILMEALISPTFGHIGVFSPLPKRDRFGNKIGFTGTQTRFRPYVGVDVGRTLKTGDSDEKIASIVRLLARARLEAQSEQLGHSIGFQQVFAYVDNTYRFVPTEGSGGRNRNFLSTGIDLVINANSSLSVRYDVGEDAPVFKKAETFSIGFGLRF